MNRAAGRDVAVVAPWYPNPVQEWAGAFVQAMVGATAPGCDAVTVYHTEAWWLRRGPEYAAACAAHRRLLPVALRAAPAVAGARLVRVPVPAVPGCTFAELAREHASWLREALGGAPIPAGVVHAHVGLRGGWTALENARPDARVFVTEHASFLDKVLAQPDSRDMYEQVLDRCTGFFAVTDVLRDKLAEAFPALAHKIETISNPISFDVLRPRPVTELRRWLYVGTLVERKGVDLLLEAFAECHAEDPGLTLTMAGPGELAGRLAERAAELGVDRAVSFLGAVDPNEATRLMRDHDLLVHAARWETFGVTIVEAVAAGLPVLVTRCGGPERTLAGIENAAGEMIDVEENAESIVAGYRRLRDRFPDGLDLAKAREVLDGRFGYRVVAEAHHRHWFPEAAAISTDAGTDASTDAGTDGGLAAAGEERLVNVLFVALGASRRPAVIRESAQVVAERGDAAVLVRNASAWAREPLPDGVDAIELPALERRYRPAAVRILLYRIPRLLLRVCLPGPLRGVGDRIDAGYRRRIARPVDDRLARLYRRDRAAIRRRVIARELRGRSVDLVVVADPQSLVTVSELVDVIADAGARPAYSIASVAHERPPAGYIRG
ncbi:glycosyltransferase [Spirillospora sp. NPDC048819]|uniref:glycosyltransferase n=1 Tax=Spirillospora sp. NPDC048819 TaxID=3155268 RepID=UPI0033E8D32B